MKSKRNKIIAIVIAAIVVIGAIAGVIFWLNGGFGPNLEPNWELASKLNTRATNAQYLPGASKLVGEEPEGQVVSTAYSHGNLFESGSMTLDQYNQLTDELGKIWHPYQGDYVIQDAKDIVVYLSANVGIFDNWFRYRGTNRQGNPEDFEEIPEGLADGEFYMTYDPETEYFRVVQAMGFQPWAYDSDTGISFWNNGQTDTDDESNRVQGPSYVNPSYQANWPVMSNDVMVINYYYIGEGENKKEVVEVEIVEFIHVYNQTTVVGYQVLKNIKDTCFTKYEINCAEDKMGSNGFSGVDYKNAVETGINNTYLQIDYTDKNNVSILEYTMNNTSKVLTYNAIIDGVKKDFWYNTEYTAPSNVELGQTTFCSLLNAITESDELSQDVDFTNAETIGTQITTKIGSATTTAVRSSYARKNYEQGLDIFNNNAVDVTDDIHKPEEPEEPEEPTDPAE